MRPSRRSRPLRPVAFIPLVFIACKRDSLDVAPVECGDSGLAEHATLEGEVSRSASPREDARGEDAAYEMDIDLNMVMPFR